MLLGVLCALGERPVRGDATVTVRNRALVRFVAHGSSGSFHGTCLYALRDGKWGCYTIKPSASKTIASAVTLTEDELAGWENGA